MPLSHIIAILILVLIAMPAVAGGNTTGAGVVIFPVVLPRTIPYPQPSAAPAGAAGPVLVTQMPRQPGEPLRSYEATGHSAPCAPYAQKPCALLPR